jgi:hypothetical protein
MMLHQVHWLCSCIVGWWEGIAMPVSTFGGHEEVHENPQEWSVAVSDLLNMQ